MLFSEYDTAATICYFNKQNFKPIIAVDIYIVLNAPCL